MQKKIEELVIEGITYVPKGSEKFKAPVTVEDKEGNKMVLVRTYSAGVHCGFLLEHDGKMVKLAKSRRIWRWYGAMELNQLAQEGTIAPEKCRFSVVTPEIILTEAIEIQNMSEQAVKSFAEVEPWRE